MTDLPAEVINNIKSFIPRDRDMKSPLSDLLKPFDEETDEYFVSHSMDIEPKRGQTYGNNFWINRKKILHRYHSDDVKTNKRRFIDYNCVLTGLEISYIRKWLERY